MALSARELLLIVRAQNQASGALRRVAGDLRGLGAIKSLRMQGQQLQITRENLQRQRQIAKNELDSIENGRRRLALDKARQSATLTSMRNDLASSGVQQSMRRNQEAMLRNEVTRSRLTRAISSGNLTGGPLRDAQKLYDAAAIGAQRLEAEQGRLARRVEVANAAIQKQQMSLVELEAREAEAANRADVLRSRMSGLGNSLALNAQKIRDNNQAINAAKWDRVAAGGRILQHSARVMEYAGLVLGGALAASAHYAANFNTEVTLAATQTRKAGQSFIGTARNSEVLQKTIIGLMKQFPATAQDMSKAAYDIYSSTNVGFSGGRKALKLFAQAAVAGQTDVATATDAGITVLNNFGNSVDLLPRKLQRMFAAVRFGRMTFHDFATSISTLGPAARAAGQSFNEMAGTFAFLTRHLSVGFARVGYARVLETLGSSQMLSGLKAAGVTITDVHNRLLPLHEIIGRLIQRFPYLEKGGVRAMNFFKDISGNKSTIQARRAFTFLVQFFKNAPKDGASYLQMLHDVNHDQNEFTQSLAAMQQTTGVKWGVFVNQLKAFALEIGANVIPALMQMAAPIQRVTSWWEKLNDSTKRSIARFATFGAAFLLVGGAFTFVAGTVLRVIATFGRLTGMGAEGIAAFAALGVAAAALTGNLSALGPVLDNIGHYAFSSFTAGLATIAAVTVAVVKLRGALTGLVAVDAAGGAAGGAGGLLGGLLGRGKAAREGFQVGRDVGGLKSGIGLALGEAGLLSASFLGTLGLVGAIGGGLYLWHRHIEAARNAAAQLKASMDLARSAGSAPRRSGDVLQGLVGTASDLQRAKLDLADIRKQIAQTRTEMTKAPASQRGALAEQLTRQLLDYGDALDKVSSLTTKSNRQFNALSVGFAQIAGNRIAVKELTQSLQDMQNKQKQLMSSGDPGEFAWAKHMAPQIDNLRNRIRVLAADGAVSARSLRSAFEGVVKGLSVRFDFKIPRGAMSDLFNISKQVGRMLTVKEIKAVVRAEVDPRAVSRIPAQLRAIFSRVKAQRVQVEVDARKVNAQNAKLKAAGKDFRIPATVDIGTTTAVAKSKHAHAQMAKIFAPINQQIHIGKPTPDPHAIGASIRAGILAGIGSIDVAVTNHVNTIVTTYQKKLQAHSPSRLMAEKVGKPITQGIAKGIIAAGGEIQKAAQITMDLFQGAILSNLDKKKKPTAKLLIKDLQDQLKGYREFNNALTRLRRRGAPKEMLDELAALGPEAADKIALLSRMSAPQLRRYVRLWQAANAEVKKSMRATQKDIADAAKQTVDDAVSKIMDAYNSFHDTNVQNFGALFEGPTNLADKVGENFTQAMDQYQSSMSDFQSQIADLNQQLVDAQKEAQQRLIDAIQQRRDELQSVMGDLFGGDWLQGTEVQTKVDWGQKLGFDDLQKDLQSQVDKFKRWRADLVSLAAKVPVDLARQLEALGPAAVDKLDILNNATSDQLAQYVATWSEGQAAINQVATQTTVDTSDITARVGDILKQIDDVTKKMGELQMPKALTGQDIINDLQAQMDQWDQYQGLLDALVKKGLPAELIQQLQEMGPKAIPYLEAINNMTKPQLDKYEELWNKSQKSVTETTIKMLNTQLQLWFQYGKNIVQNIVAGVSSEQQRLEKYFREVISNILKGMHLDTPPIAPQPPDTNTNPNPVVDPGDLGPPDPWQTRAGATGGTTVVVQPGASLYQVNATNDESLSSTLERASFRLTNRTVG